MMDGLLWKLDECVCKYVEYADDLLLLVEGQSRVEIERKGTEWIMCEWSENIGLCVSEGKTMTMLLKDSMAASRIPCVRMNGKLIRYAECVKYLGIRVSEKMHFKVHFE